MFIRKNRLIRPRIVAAMVILSFVCGSMATAQKRDPQDSRVQQINASIDNGIFVDTTKVYDDSSLQLMLNSARLRLAALQTFDQTGLSSRIGAVTGATLQQQAISAQILGPPLPGTAETSLGATGTNQTVTNPTGQTVTNTAGLSVQNVTTTTPQMTASAPPLPANSAGLPTSGFNVSSLDALNEMMQLTYEIANLQLLLEGSLSDRYVRGERIIKPRTTLGFPITITTQERYKGAVAVVEIETISPSRDNTFSDEPPTVTALLPREKTYNVASITDKMTSVGGGIVTQVINGGFSYLRGRKSYYIVQDQDTLAMMQRGSTAPATPSTVFSWQFRPVLGQNYVRSGMRQTFVQLAVPAKATSGCFGGIKIKTYWRKYDRKRGVLKEVIADSIRESDVFQPIPVFDQTPVIEDVDMKDLGSGVVQATVEGKFLNGTYVRVGNNFYRDGSLGFTSEVKQIRFNAPAADVAKYRAYLVSRDGTETEIVAAQAPINLPKLSTTCGSPTVQPPFVPVSVNAAIEVAAYDNSNSILTVRFSNSLPPVAPSLDEYHIILGGKVFGLTDTPIERFDEQGKGVLKAVIPTNLLLSSTNVEVKPLFWREDYTVKKSTGTFKAENSADKIVAYKQSAGGITTFLLYGNRLTSAKILVPDGIELMPFEDYPDTDTLRSFALTTDQIKGKQIVLQKNRGERPITISLPASGDADKKPTLSVKGRIIVGADDVTVSGDSLDKLKKVTFGDNEIKFALSKDKKTVTLTKLVTANVTSAPLEQELVFEFEGGVKSTLKLDIVNSKIEMIQRNSN